MGLGQGPAGVWLGVEGASSCWARVCEEYVYCGGEGEGVSGLSPGRWVPKTAKEEMSQSRGCWVPFLSLSRVLSVFLKD